MNTTEPVLPQSSPSPRAVVEEAVATLLPRETSREVAVSKCSVRGESKWRVRWHEVGRVHRKFFDSREAADSHAATVRGDEVNARRKLALLPQSVQEKLLIIHTESVKRGCDILAFLSAPVEVAAASPNFEAVIKELIQVKTKHGNAARYTDNVRCILQEFARGREGLAINKISLPDVEAYLDTKKLVSRAFFRSRLSTLFNFAVRRGYMVSNPCSRLESVKVTRKPPTILTLAETKKALEWLKLKPRLMGWFILSTFAGLRPEEAEKTTWNNINFEEGYIKVEAQTSKKRQQRLVYAQPMAFTWLKWFKSLNKELTVGRYYRKQLLVELREVLGWKVWKKDVTRHSCASYWLTQTGQSAHIAEMLGHTEGELKKHYRGISYEDGSTLTKADAEKFWKLRPAK